MRPEFKRKWDLEYSPVGYLDTDECASFEHPAFEHRTLSGATSFGSETVDLRYFASCYIHTHTVCEHSRTRLVVDRGARLRCEYTGVFDVIKRKELRNIEIKSHTSSKLLIIRVGKKKFRLALVPLSTISLTHSGLE